MFWYIFKKACGIKTYYTAEPQQKNGGVNRHGYRMHIRMTQAREETAIADKTRSIEQLLNYFQKTVDNEGAVVYNNN